MMMEEDKKKEEDGTGSTTKVVPPQERINLLVFGHGTAPQQRIVRHLLGQDGSSGRGGTEASAVVRPTGTTIHERELTIDGDPLRLVFSCFGAKSNNFKFLQPLLHNIDDHPDGLLFAYSLNSSASRDAITQWSQGLAGVFSKLSPGAGPRYMFIGDLTAAGEDAESALEGYARMSVRILHEGAQVKFFLTENGKEAELDAAFQNFLKPILQQKQVERHVRERAERERLLAEELKQWEAEIGKKAGQTNNPALSTKTITELSPNERNRKGSIDARSQTWDEGAVRRRLLDRYDSAKDKLDGDAGLADIVRLEGHLLGKSPPEQRSWVRCGSPTSTSSSPPTTSSLHSSGSASGSFLSGASTRGGSSLYRSTSGTGLRGHRIKKDVGGESPKEIEDILRRTKSHDTHHELINDDSSQDDISCVSEIDDDSGTGGESEAEEKLSSKERRRGGTGDETKNSLKHETNEAPSLDAEVREALDSLSLSRYNSVFAKANISYEDFLHLDEDDLKSRFNLPSGASKKIKSFQKRHVKVTSSNNTPNAMRRSEPQSPAPGRSKKGTSDSPVKEGSGKRAIMSTLKRKLSTVPAPPEAADAKSPEEEKRSIFTRKPSFSMRGAPPALAKVQELVKEKGINYYDEKTAATLLHIECEKEELDKNTIEFLVNSGADPNAVDKDGWTPLHVLCKRKQVIEDAPVIRLFLMRGAKAGVATKEGAVPLHYLVRRNPANDDEVKMFCRSLDALLNVGKASINAVNTHGETPLFHAVMHSNLAVVDALIERKASFLIANRAGATPLHFAVLTQKPDIVQRLLELGVSPDIITDHRMGSPLELARKQTGHKGKIIMQMLSDKAENKTTGSFIAVESPSKGTTKAKETVNQGTGGAMYMYSTLKSNGRSKKNRVRVTPLRADRWIIDPTELTFTTEIGSGAFGSVWKGEWRGKPVAIKKLYFTGDNETKLEAFRQESFIMTSLEPHPNLVQLVGVCSKAPDLAIVSEWCPEGDMLQLLKRRKGRLSLATKIRMAIAAAAGMAYLHQHDILHNDIAARNLLVVKSLDGYDVKIADFGLSTSVLSATVPSVGPLKWLAPEAGHPLNPKFSTKSDVWSFGVVLWELLTDGAEPFDDLAPELAAREVREGRRLVIPHTAPASLKNLIDRCWSKDCDARPSFEEIGTELRRSLQEIHSTTPTRSNSVDRRPRRSTPSVQIDEVSSLDDDSQLKVLEAKIPGFVLMPQRRRRRDRGDNGDSEFSPSASQEVALSPRSPRSPRSPASPRSNVLIERPGALDESTEGGNNDNDESDTDSGSESEGDDGDEAQDDEESMLASGDAADSLPYRRMPTLTTDT